MRHDAYSQLSMYDGSVYIPSTVGYAALVFEKTRPNSYSFVKSEPNPHSFHDSFTGVGKKALCNHRYEVAGSAFICTLRLVRADTNHGLGLYT